jgi:hypothetical protein
MSVTGLLHPKNTSAERAMATVMKRVFFISFSLIYSAARFGLHIFRKAYACGL